MASVGGEKARTGAPLENFGGRLDGWNQTAGAKQPAAPIDPDRPTFTKEELESLAPDPDAAGEDETLVSARNAIKNGVMTPTEAAKHYNLPADELAALDPKPAPSRKSAEAELAELRALRTSDPKKYWSDDVQARELALLQVGLTNAAHNADAKGKAKSDEGKGENEGEETDDAGEAGWLPGPEASDLPEEMLARWDEQGGRTHHYKQAQDTVRAIVEGIEDADERGEMRQSFDGLPDMVRHHVINHLSVSATHGGEASKAEVDRFAEFPEGAELVKEWGRHAARNIKTARTRIKGIVDAMPADRQATAKEWLEGLSPEQAKAMYRGLAR